MFVLPLAMKYHIPFCILAELPQNVLAHCCQQRTSTHKILKFAEHQLLRLAVQGRFQGQARMNILSAASRSRTKILLGSKVPFTQLLATCYFSSGGDKHWKSTLIFSVLSKLSDFEQYILISSMFLCKHPLGIYLLDVHSLSYPFLIIFCNNLLRIPVMSCCLE